MGWWKSLVKGMQEFVCGSAPEDHEDEEPEDTSPPTPRSPVATPPEAKPYRKPASPVLVKAEDLMYNIRGDEGRDAAVIEAIKTKTKRRALRYFNGTSEREVRHRVTEKKTDSIEFAFFRRSGKPLHIRWQNKPEVPQPLES